MEIIQRTIKALSLKRIEEGSIGFMPNEEETWYNVIGETEDLQELVKNVVAKGNTIEFEYNNGVVGSLKLIQKAPEKESNKFDDMTNFEDLLEDAHAKFGKKLNITTELLDVDYEKSQATFKATVEIEHDDEKIQEFTAHGDASGIGSEMIKPHFIRMAETRAIARALRWATNNAKVAVEETSETPKKK